MSDNDNNVVIQRQGIGFCGVLFIVFLILKLGVGSTIVMGWSWIWIFSPLWGPLALCIGILSFIAISMSVIMLCIRLLSLIGSTIRKRQNNKK